MPLLRAVALNVIKSLVPLNLPGAQIIHHLQQMHIAYRRTDMLKDIRTAFDRVKYETRIIALKPETRIPEAWMNTEKLGSPFNYRLKFKTQVYDPGLGIYKPEYGYMFVDEYDTKGDWETAFPDYASNIYEAKDYENMDFKVVGVTKNMREEPAPF